MNLPIHMPCTYWKRMWITHYGIQKIVRLFHYQFLIFIQRYMTSWWLLCYRKFTRQYKIVKYPIKYGECEVCLCEVCLYEVCLCEVCLCEVCLCEVCLFCWCFATRLLRGDVDIITLHTLCCFISTQCKNARIPQCSDTNKWLSYAKCSDTTTSLSYSAMR